MVYTNNKCARKYSIFNYALRTFNTAGVSIDSALFAHCSKRGHRQFPVIQEQLEKYRDPVSRVYISTALHLPVYVLISFSLTSLGGSEI